jgi:hypothetical protein
MSNIKPFRGKLENWKELTGVIHGIGLGGNIFGDDRFEDGKYIFTSEVVKLDYENNKLETLNSLYDLGKEYSV